MKLVTFNAGEGDRLGVLSNDNSVIDLIKADSKPPAFRSMQALIESGEEGLKQARSTSESAIADGAALIPNGQYKLCAPLPVPQQVRDFMCFEKHLKQSLESATKLRAMVEGLDMNKALETAKAAGALDIPDIWRQQPVYYKANRFAVSAPEETITWPTYSMVMDYECELACIIGRKGKNIASQDARPYIFGFTILNDFSARDAQNEEMKAYLGPAKGKDFDGANAMGPCIVTLDEIGDPYALDMIVRINGQERSHGSSSTMHWKFEDLIAWVSRDETLYPGEVFGSGTVGDGCGLELMQFLADGDVIELEISKIGTLRNTVRSGS